VDAKLDKIGDLILPQGLPVDEHRPAISFSIVRCGRSGTGNHLVDSGITIGVDQDLPVVGEGLVDPRMRLFVGSAG